MERLQQPCIFSLENRPYNSMWSTGRLKHGMKVLYTLFKIGYNVYFINWSVDVLAFLWLNYTDYVQDLNSTSSLKLSIY
jgi:hypothetical protein